MSPAHDDDRTVNRADPAHAAEICALAAARARPDTTTVISIDGPAGSGKSSLAALVAAQLEDSVLVHMDDLFAGWDGLVAAPALLTAQVLAPVARREPARFRRFDWEADKYADLVDVPSTAYLVVEGCGSSVGIARPYAAVRVWLEADTALRMSRGLARDGDMFAPHWERWARQESDLYAADRTRVHAHLRFRTD